MKFSILAEYFKKIEKVSSRLSITHLLAELFKKLNADEIDKTMYLLMGRVGPLYESPEFGMADKMIIRSLIAALNLEKKYFEDEYKKIGDLGQTVEKFKKQYRSYDDKDLSILDVYNELYNLVEKTGLGSQKTKVNILAHLFRQLNPLSSRYLARIPTGTMRLGFSDMTVLDALSWMVKGDKSLRPQIQAAYHVRPDLGYIGKIIKGYGTGGLKKIVPEVFTPILMMRAERLSSGCEIIDKIGKAMVEPKYDGFRLQVHIRKNHSPKVELYSRNLENVSLMYPDIVESVLNQTDCQDAIFEGEAIGFDPNTNNFLPFQQTAQRKRKYDIEKTAMKIPLKLFVFELLYLNGKSYLNLPFSMRRQTLEKIIKKTRDHLKDAVFLSPNTTISDPKKLDIMFEDAISKGLEGIIAKKIDGIYQPGARGSNWIKFKRSYSSKIEDTIDCLVMGYDFGKGKRTIFGLGAFLVGVLDEKKDKFVTVAKIGTGLTDEEWRELKAQSSKLKVKDKPNDYEVDKMMECDVWIKPKLVVEIKADEITRSSVHTAGRILKPSRSGGALEIRMAGYALRFPRLERFREDKRPEDVTNLSEIEKMYKRQKS